MLSKSRLFTLAQLVWGLLLGGMFVVLYSGQAASVVDPAMLPRPIWAAGGGTLLLVLLGWLIIERLKKRAWVRMGRQADLSVDGSGGLLSGSKPSFSGVVRGRPVRVHLASRKVSTASAEGRSKKTIRHTMVETDVDDSALESGLILGRIGSGEVTAERTTLRRLRIPNEPVEDPFVTLEGTADLARDILTPEVREALEAVDSLEFLLVGDAVGAVKDTIERQADADDVPNLFVEAFDEAFHHDPSTVASQISGTLLDADELERQLEAVTAVAARVEELEGTPADNSETVATN